MNVKNICLLSKEEYDEINERIPLVNEAFWLGTPSATSGTVWSVDKVGFAKADCSVNQRLGVRPVIVFDSDKFFPGDRVEAFGYKWTVIDFSIIGNESRALCDSVITRKQFDEHTNCYEKSSIREFLDDWLKIRTNEMTTPDDKDMFPDIANEEIEKFNDYKFRMVEAVSSLRNAWNQCAYMFGNINYDCNDFIVDGYPFDKSFDDINVSDWCESVINKLLNYDINKDSKTVNDIINDAKSRVETPKIVDSNEKEIDI